MIDKNNSKSTLHFLINADFSHERGYSYGEMINFLKTFQAYYRECYIKREQFEQELIHKDKTFEQIKNRITYVEKLLKEKETENVKLYSQINRKLTFWERLTGKINLKY